MGRPLSGNDRGLFSLVSHFSYVGKAMQQRKNHLCVIVSFSQNQSKIFNKTG